VPGDGEVNEAWSQRLSVAAWELLFTLTALAGDMVIEANFHPHSELEVDRLRGLGDTAECCIGCNKACSSNQVTVRPPRRRHPHRTARRSTSFS